MIWNYLKVALRNLLGNRGYTAINVAGLSIGVAVCLLIALFVIDELKFDAFHEKGDRIYRLVMEWKNPRTGGWHRTSTGQYRVRDPLLNDFPEFERVIRVSRWSPTVSVGEKRFTERRWLFADDGFLDTFTFPLVEGDPATALAEPFSVLMTPETARKYFGTADVVGRTVTYNGQHDFKVTGVVAPAPAQSHLHFDFVASMSTGEQIFSRIIKENWGEGSVHVYVLAPEAFDTSTWAAQMPAFVAKHDPEREGQRSFGLEPLRDIHLRTDASGQYEPGGSIEFVYAFSAIAAFILLIACFNFMNLATARSAGRAREVGVRKVVGAVRGQVAAQFLVESTLLALLSLAVAVGLVELALPTFNGELNRALSFTGEPAVLAVLLTIVTATGLVAGSYPALFLSGFHPIEVIKGRIRLAGGSLRRVLVTSQFAISICLVILTAVVYQQLMFGRNIRLGYDKDHVVLVRNVPQSFRTGNGVGPELLTAHPAITHAALTSRFPSGRLGSNIGIFTEGVSRDDRKGMQMVWVGYDFFETLDIPVVAGRTFQSSHAEAYRAFVLNESAVKDLGWTPAEAIGKPFGTEHITEADGQWEEVEGTVVGVVSDVYFENLRERIKPMVYFLAPRMAWNLLIRVRPDDVAGALDHLESVWPRIRHDRPLAYDFLDDRFDRLYRAESMQGRLFGAFAGLAVFVACLGLIGLASFSAARRTKEIGIRKVLGASEGTLVFLLSSEFTRLVVLANVVAWPVAYYFGEQWLSSFAYRTEIGVATLLLGGFSVLLVALATVGSQALRAASADPVKALRYE